MGRPESPRPESLFELPPSHKGDAEYSSLTNTAYTAHDVIVNGEELPQPFVFKLQGQDNHPDNDPKTSDKPYTAYIDPTVRMPISPIQQKPTLSNELAAPPIRLAVTQA